MVTHWNKEYDVVVVGAGAAGFTAAITAKLQGLSVLLIEKTDKYGGSTALSGGAIWVPNNICLQEAGLEDSMGNARKYMSATVGDSSPKELQEAYLTKGPEMVKYLRRYTHIDWSYVKNYSDYYPDMPGGRAEGRSVEAKIFNLKKLGREAKNMRRSEMPTMGMVIKSAEFYKINMFTRTFSGFMTALKVGLRLIATIFSFGYYRPSSLGEALIGRMMLSYKQMDGELWLSSPFDSLLFDDNGKVNGINVKKNGEVVAVTVKGGVVLSSGGFSHNQLMREMFLPQPTNHKWSLAAPGQKGDAIKEAIKIGAKIGLMDKVWGTPTALPPGMPPYMAVADRAAPGIIIIDQDGKRYLNECMPYHQFVDRMYEHNNETGAYKSIPSWFVFDRQVKSRYLVFGVFPGLPIPKEWFEKGFVITAQTIPELALKMKVSEKNFINTVKSYNDSAIIGYDDQFHKGENAYDRFYGDPTLINPNVAPLCKAPYYAIRLYPGDIGTKGGVVIDKNARALKKDGTPIEGLYAAGNASASVMGDTYPGPGATIGSAMVFGYIAAKHIAEKRSDQN